MSGEIQVLRVKPTTHLLLFSAFLFTFGCSQNTSQKKDCIPSTCEDLGIACGQHDDGCSDSIFCGDCLDGFSCHEGTCVEEEPPEKTSVLFAFSKARLTDPLQLQQRGFDAVRDIGQRAGELADFAVHLMQEYVRTLDDYIADPQPFIVTSDLVLEQLQQYSDTLSNHNIIIVYSHSHGIQTIPGTRMGGLVLDDPGDSGEYPGLLTWPQYAAALLELPAETVIVLTMSCFSGGLINYFNNHPGSRSLWENRASEGRDFVVISSQNAETLSNPRLIDGVIINPFTHAVIKALEGHADGHARDGVSNEPDGIVTLQELAEFIQDETRRYTSENDSENDPDPQITGSFRPEKVIFHTN